MDWFELELDLFHMLRKLKLKDWFANPPTFSNTITSTATTPITKSELYLKDFSLSLGTDFVPNTTYPAVDTFFLLVKNDIDHLKTCHTDQILLHPNMRHEELKAVKELSENNSIVIRQADKGVLLSCGTGMIIWRKP